MTDMDLKINSVKLEVVSVDVDLDLEDSSAIPVLLDSRIIPDALVHDETFSSRLASLNDETSSHVILIYDMEWNFDRTIPCIHGAAAFHCHIRCHLIFYI